MQLLHSPTRIGVALCLASGIAFSVQPMLVTLALDRGAAISSVLAWRYVIAAVVLAALAGRRLLRVPLRVALTAFGVGAVVYAADSFLFYAALDRTSAPLASLVHYGHLAVVVAVAAATGRERIDARRIGALVAVLGGIALVGGGATSFDGFGLGLALAAAGAYAIYVLVSDRLLRAIDPIAISAFVISGTAVPFVVSSAFTGGLGETGGLPGLSIVALTALLGSSFAATAFLAGVRRIGPGTASLLVTVEVPIGITLAALVLGQRLSVAQLVGAGLVVGALVLLSGRKGLRPGTDEVEPVPTIELPSVEPRPANALAA